MNINITSLHSLVEKGEKVDEYTLLIEVDMLYCAIKCVGYENVIVYYDDVDKNGEKTRIKKKLSSLPTLIREIADYICRLKYRFPIEDARFDAYWGLNGFNLIHQYDFFALTGFGRHEIKHLSTISDVVKALTITK